MLTVWKRSALFYLGNSCLATVVACSYLSCSCWLPPKLPSYPPSPPVFHRLEKGKLHMLCHISPSRCQCPSVPAMQTAGSFPLGVFLDVTEPERTDFSLFALDGSALDWNELQEGFIYSPVWGPYPLSLKISKRLKLTVVSNCSDNLSI